MSFPFRFLICNIFLSLLLGFLLLLKKRLNNHITLHAQYRLWYIFIFALFLPFLPFGLPAPEGFFLTVLDLFSHGSVSSPDALGVRTAAALSSEDMQIQDLSAAVSSSDPLIHKILWWVWLGGIFLTAVFFILSMIKIYLLRKNSAPITDQTEPELYRQYCSCMKELNLKRSVALYASCRLTAPVSYGWLRPKIIIPSDLDIVLSREDIRFIFLHELIHYKHRDFLLNSTVCILQILYWFNPFLWFGFSRMKKDREISCDHAVLQAVGKENSLQYGYTLIRYAEKMQKKTFFTPLSTLGDSKSTIRQRILEIADYRKDSLSKKIKSAGLFLFVIGLVYCSSPLFTIYASMDSSFGLSGQDWETLDAASFFDGMEGSFVLYDMQEEKYHIYNPALSALRISPYSTFKIYSGLFALEENIISPEADALPWDGTSAAFPVWEKEQTLTSAMKNSVNWYFQRLDEQMGLSALYQYYSRISYGNCDLSGGIEGYWADSSLKISAAEQVSLLAGLLQNQWDFQEKNLEAVKNAMFLSDTPYGKLYGKTGTGAEKGDGVGWFVGFLEQGDEIYCFTANLLGKDARGETAYQITLDVLSSLL